MTRVLLTAAFVLLAAGDAAAQQRPLTTEDPETIGAGRIPIGRSAEEQRTCYCVNPDRLAVLKRLVEAL